MGIRILTDESDVRTVRPAWNEIVNESSRNILGVDVTCTHEWAETLWQTWQGRLHDGRLKVLVLDREGRDVGVLPLYTSKVTKGRFPYRQLAPVTHLYSGRTGFLLSEPSEDDLARIIDFLYRDLAGWDLFEFTLVADSVSERLLSRLQTSGRYGIRRIETEQTPYIELAPTWTEYYESLSRKFRSNLRRGQRRLEELGEVAFREIADIDEADEFEAIMLDIEKSSWKQTAGSSVTVNDHQEEFYRRLLPVAARTGWLCCHVLTVAGTPVAYSYGLNHNGTFYGLKTSYRSEHRSHSPGQVLLISIIEQLHARGNVRYLDMMGSCEDYKLKFTSKTYSRSTYVMYNNSARGIAARLKGWAASNWGRRTNESAEAVSEAV